ncbi:calbindin-32-like [Asterias rubens]|uniref:calbindin-32-like n=1 Tax=Asterias rubens TaxID=7604 RepID=UPI001455684C|nr:calbindin-32-like [Asterias rubens]
MDKESAIENMRKQFEDMTAEDFAQTWNKYDADGNGFIEGGELTCFFRDLVTAKKGSSQEAMSCVMLEEVIKQYMDAYDDDGDGKIGMAELAEILKPEENFMLILKTQDAQLSRADFDKIWQTYDNDQNGYIDTAELKSFLKEVLKEKKLNDATLEKYTAALLKMLDSNDDKKLEREEMKKFFSIKE